MNWFDFEFSAFLWIFIVLNVVNVIIQTIKSIATIKCGAWAAASINAIAYGLYTVVVVYMNADGLGVLWKAIIIGVANLLGVYVVKLVEEKKRKDKLWLVKSTIDREKAETVRTSLKTLGIPFQWYDLEKYFVFDCYCANQEQTAKVTELFKAFDGKMFATENKLNL